MKLKQKKVLEDKVPNGFLLECHGLPLNTMENLSDEILLKVFSNLELVDIVEHVRFTCKRFWTLASDLSLWRDVTFGAAESLSRPFQDALRTCSKSVVKFTIDGRQSEGLKILLRENKYFPKLKRLHLMCTDVTVDDFKKLVSIYSSVEMIEMQYYFRTNIEELQKLKRLNDLHNVTFVKTFYNILPYRDCITHTTTEKVSIIQMSEHTRAVCLLCCFIFMICMVVCGCIGVIIFCFVFKNY